MRSSTSALVKRETHAEQTTFYVQTDDGAIVLDESEPINPRPHTLYRQEGDEATYYEGFGFIPFFRLDNNKKQQSGLKTVKDLIDDYDLMASSLSNNLVDFDTPIHSLLDLKCSKLEIRIKQFLRKILKVVIKEINDVNGTDYQQKDVYFSFKHEIMSNAQENAEIALTEAQEQQTRINTLLGLAGQLDQDTLIKSICDALDIDYDEIKDKLPVSDEEDELLKTAQQTLDGVKGEGGIIE